MQNVMTSMKTNPLPYQYDYGKLADEVNAHISDMNAKGWRLVSTASSEFVLMMFWEPSTGV